MGSRANTQWTGLSILVGALLIVRPQDLTAQGIHEWDGADDGDAFAYSVASGGDIDADGVADVLVGAPLHEAAFVQQGRAYAYSGATGGLLFSWDGESANGQLGGKVAGAGDVNGDGHADVLIAAYLSSANGLHSGKVYVYSGINGALIYAVVGAQYDDYLGVGLTGLGDVDGDQVPDFAASAPIARNPEIGRGRVRVYSGVDGRVFREYAGPHLVADFGASLASVPDVDGDGVSELAVGAPYAVDPSDLKSSGVVYLYSGRTGALLQSLGGDDAGDAFGYSVAGVRDLDGDGAGEVLIGGFSAGDHGRAWLCSGTTGARLRQFEGDSLGGAFGFAVAAADADADGIDELLVGAPNHLTDGLVLGRAFVYSGIDGSLQSFRDGAFPQARFGAALASGFGDVDGDGDEEVAVGAWNHAGRGRAILTSAVLDPPPRLFGIAPELGSYKGGAVVTITGSGFVPGETIAVDFDGVSSPQVTRLSFTELTCVVPSGLPGVATIRASTRFGSAELRDAWLYTPAIVLSGDPIPGGQITLAFHQDALDSIFAIWGLPPETAIPTPPFAGLLGIEPFWILFMVRRWPAPELDVDLDLPADPGLSGVEILFQALVGPGLFDASKDGTWTDTVHLTIQ